MKNIAFQDIAGGTVNVYSANKNLPRLERIKTALKELQHTGNIKIFLCNGKKLRLINVKRY